jgi:uncharacterized membrane protein
MAHLVTGLFKNSKKAGEAVSELKQKGYTEDISVLAKEWEGTEIKLHTVKDKDAGVGGAITGAVIGGLAGLLLSVGTIVVPGIGALLVAGPFAVLMGTAGALTGGLISALVDAGIPEDKARMYEDAIKRGEVLIAVSVDHEDEKKVRSILDKHNARETDTRHQAFASM